MTTTNAVPARATGLRLTKPEREAVRQLYGGRCAYCGVELGARWCADHREAVYRGYGADGKTPLRPENHRIDNMMPSCSPCNLDKAVFTIEQWRAKLQRSAEVLARNVSTYRHAVRFGQVVETGAPVLFYFERLAMEQSGTTTTSKEADHHG